MASRWAELLWLIQSVSNPLAECEQTLVLHHWLDLIRSPSSSTSHWQPAAVPLDTSSISTAPSFAQTSLALAWASTLVVLVQFQQQVRLIFWFAISAISPAWGLRWRVWETEVWKLWEILNHNQNYLDRAMCYRFRQMQTSSSPCLSPSAAVNWNDSQGRLDSAGSCHNFAQIISPLTELTRPSILSPACQIVFGVLFRCRGSACSSWQ